MPCTQGHVLDSIFDLIGTPTQYDMAFTEDENAKAYMRKFRPRPRADMHKVFPQISYLGRHLLTQMLQFNPQMRLTTEMCLRHPYFKGLF